MAGDEQLPARQPPKESPGQMDLALAREFLDVTRKDMELRSQDLALRKDGQSQSHEYALAALKAQATDRESGRQCRIKAVREYLVFAGIVLLLLLGFGGVALAYNKEAIVVETLKILGPFIGGLGAGAFFGYRKGQKDSSDKPDPEPEQEPR